MPDNYLEDSQIIKDYQWFHRHPELGHEETETTAYIKEALQEAGIEILPLPSENKTGVIAVIRGKGESVSSDRGPVVALRTDIDGLPVEEMTDVSYKSLYPGRMHACGHDFHMASVLQAARLLQQTKEEWSGTVKVIFQPAEELPGGAKEMVKTGLLEDVDAYVGLHTTPGRPSGAIGIRAGGLMAAVDRFEVTVSGRGCHGAAPHEGIDVIPVICQIVTAPQTIVSRQVDPFSPAVLSVTAISAGNTWNVIPSEGSFCGTVRSFSPQVRAQIRERFYRLTEQIAGANGAKCRIDWYEGPPAVINDEGLCKIATQTAAESGYQVYEPEQTMVGEDFSFYQEKQKGIFLRVGTGYGKPLHHPEFLADSAALEPTAEYLAILVKKLLAEMSEVS